MPAVRLVTLRREMTPLWGLLDDPAAFAQHLRHLFSRYANPTYRAGQAVASSLLPAYHLPPAAFNGIWQGLRQQVSRRPERALPLAQALWNEAHLEPRLLAARLLGLAPPEEAVLAQFWSWLAAASDPQVQRALLEHGSARLVAEAADAFLQHVAQILPQPGPLRRLALQALVALVNHPSFENAPPLYRALRPVLLDLDPDERPEATALLQALARRWPQEVNAYLRRVWGEAASRPGAATLAWVIRRVLPYLPPESTLRQRVLSPVAKE